MTPGEVVSVYRRQAAMLMKYKHFLENNTTLTRQEIVEASIIIINLYAECLSNFAGMMEQLSSHQNVKFYPVKALENKYNEPPFDREFFNQDH